MCDLKKVDIYREKQHKQNKTWKWKVHIIVRRLYFSYSIGRVYCTNGTYRGLSGVALVSYPSLYFVF